TLTLVLIESIVPVVNPVVRPLLATLSPTDGAITILLGTPISSINPLASINPGLSSATAASTLDPSAGAAVKSATTVEAAQPLSIKPGCEMSSPALACPLSPNTWLLLRTLEFPPAVTIAPIVPLQQNLLVMSLTLPPETPKCMLRV